MSIWRKNQGVTYLLAPKGGGGVPAQRRWRARGAAQPRKKERKRRDVGATQTNGRSPSRDEGGRAGGGQGRGRRAGATRRRRGSRACASDTDDRAARANGAGGWLAGAKGAGATEANASHPDAKRAARGGGPRASPPACLGPGRSPRAGDTNFDGRAPSGPGPKGAGSAGSCPGDRLGSWGATAPEGEGRGKTSSHRSAAPPRARAAPMPPKRRQCLSLSPLGGWARREQSIFHGTGQADGPGWLAECPRARSAGARIHAGEAHPVGAAWFLAPARSRTRARSFLGDGESDTEEGRASANGGERSG